MPSAHPKIKRGKPVAAIISTHKNGVSLHHVGMTRAASDRSYHHYRLWQAIILLCLSLFLPTLTSAKAQERGRPQSYWQYTASGRLDTVVTADINGDGIDEFLILDENGRLTLLLADGSEEWSQPSPDPITAIGVVDILDNQTPEQEIAIAGMGYLAVWDARGDLVWRASLPRTTRPVAIAAIDYHSDGRGDVLVLLASGQLLAYSATGENIWQFAGQENANVDVSPQIVVADFDGDGADEIVMSLFTPRRFSEIIYLDNYTVAWRQAISRRIATLTEVAFEPDTSFIAVGTNFGQLDLYAPDGTLVWFRTVNRPITSATFVELVDEPALVVGTATGSVISYSREGRRLWTNNLAKDANREVQTISPANRRAVNGQVSLSVILGPPPNSTQLSDIFLLSDKGQILAKVGDTDSPNLTRLTDVNNDAHYELLLAQFATLQLFGLGIGDSDYIQEWKYTLNAAPTAALVADLDNDGEEEIVVGAHDGRLHGLNTDGSVLWLSAPGKEITHLEVIHHSLTEPPQVVVVRREQPVAEYSNTSEVVNSRLELREATGERLWEVIIPAQVTSLAIDDRLGSGTPTILVGTQDGQIIAYDLSGHKHWEAAAANPASEIQYITVVSDGPAGRNPIIAASGQELIQLTPSNDGVLLSAFARFPSDVIAAYHVSQPGETELAVRVIVFTADGLVHGLNRQGIEMEHWNWPTPTGGVPTVIQLSGPGIVEAFQKNIISYMVATEDGTLEQLVLVDNRPAITWKITNLGSIQALSWADLNQDGQPDTGLVGSRDGTIYLYERLQTRNPSRVLELPLSSSVFHVTLLKRASRQSPDLLAITHNGLVHLLREEENRPPLLTKPQVEVERDQFTIGISVQDVENDAVAVQLELRDEATGAWLPQSEQRLATGNGQLFWPGVTVPEGTSRINYRFRFNDDLYHGYLTPPIGPEVIAGRASNGSALIAGASLGFLALVGLAIFIRQEQTPGARATRFYNRLSQNPENILPQLEHRYSSESGSPDFLLQLANRARQANDLYVSNLADGLFLLDNRPQAGLPIITRVLDDIAGSDNIWNGLYHRRLIFKTCQALLEAPSVTELGLLRPQFVHVLSMLEERNEQSPILESLLPVLTNMRDSERVDAVDDRLVYLNQAAVRLRQVQEQLDEYPPSIERTLTRAIARRWSGLLTAEIEEHRGRAQLEVTLKTRRLAPNERTHVAMEIHNIGRAPAENIVATLNENPAYRIWTEPQIIPFLPSGRSRQVRFMIEPQAEERFRVAISLTYDDRNRHDKTVAFGDMVYLLPPVRQFTPIVNPYLPGTPLRKESPLFFGREELFDFIAEHAGMQSQRNVFMLVGQRRTGKTSLLLRLEDYLPPQLLPVYIDCQSLGVSPGMPALLQEFAWHIADALAGKDITVDVPEFNEWQPDPARVFQRGFLPAVRRLLPADTTLLLVFDEFEAFESMVADGVLPRTFFPYMRHLMQHSTGLGFVFVGTRRLEEMSADYWSVLFNIALYRKIDFLSKEAASRLIREPVAPHIIYDDLAIDKILRVTAGHPYFLQLVCYTLVKQANQQKTGYVTISDVNVALDEMLRLGEVHFAYIWQRANLAERAVLSAAAHLMDRNEPLHPEAFIEYLQSYSIELDPIEVTHALNALVERDIMREVMEEGKALYELRIGLVGEWVAQNKSLSRLHIHLEG